MADDLMEGLYQILRGNPHDFNRRILKTVCPVVWEGAEAKSSVPDPIRDLAYNDNNHLHKTNACEAFPKIILA